MTQNQQADTVPKLPTRRRSAITQADIARIIRAAKQAGAAQIELRLSDSARILIRLQPDKPLAETEDIVL